MKILYLSNAVLPSEQSRSLSIMRVCQAFHDAGHETILSGITLKEPPADPVAFYGLRGGFKVVLTHLNALSYNRVTRKFMLAGLYLGRMTRGLLHETQPDLIYSRLTILELLFVPPTTPILYEMHSLGPLGEAWWQRALFKWIVKTKNFRRFIVTSTILADLLKQHLPDKEIVIARLSAEPPVLIETNTLQNFKTTQLQGSNFQRHVGYTGYLDTYGQRGTDMICQVAAAMPDTAFHIVGGEATAVEHWKNYASDWNKNGNIFFYGYRNPAEMPLFLNCFDVVLAPLQHRPSRRAPTGQNMSPLKLPQYMGYGKAIVASDIPAHREILVSNENAMLVPHDDVSAWKNAIKNLVDDAALRQKIEMKASQDYQRSFHPETRIKTMLAGV